MLPPRFISIFLCTLNGYQSIIINLLVPCVQKETWTRRQLLPQCCQWIIISCHISKNLVDMYFSCIFFSLSLCVSLFSKTSTRHRKTNVDAIPVAETSAYFDHYFFFTIKTINAIDCTFSLYLQVREHREELLFYLQIRNTENKRYAEHETGGSMIEDWACPRLRNLVSDFRSVIFIKNNSTPPKLLCEISYTISPPRSVQFILRIGIASFEARLDRRSSILHKFASFLFYTNIVRAKKFEYAAKNRSWHLSFASWQFKYISIDPQYRIRDQSLPEVERS